MHQALCRATQSLTRDLNHATQTSNGTGVAEHIRQRGISAVDHAIAAHRADRVLGEDETATLLILLGNLTVRDHALVRTGPNDVDLRTDLTRRAPADLAPAPATLLACAAMRSGNGALANVALDRATAADPDYTMAHLLRTALHSGVHPTIFAAWLAEAATEPE